MAVQTINKYGLFTVSGIHTGKISADIWAENCTRKTVY
jgi:hypothetical protein